MRVRVPQASAMGVADLRRAWRERSRLLHPDVREHMHMHMHMRGCFMHMHLRGCFTRPCASACTRARARSPHGTWCTGAPSPHVCVRAHGHMGMAHACMCRCATSGRRRSSNMYPMHVYTCASSCVWHVQVRDQRTPEELEGIPSVYELNAAFPSYHPCPDPSLPTIPCPDPSLPTIPCRYELNAAFEAVKKLL